MPTGLPSYAQKAAGKVPKSFDRKKKSSQFMEFFWCFVFAFASAVAVASAFVSASAFCCASAFASVRALAYCFAFACFLFRLFLLVLCCCFMLFPYIMDCCLRLDLLRPCSLAFDRQSKPCGKNPNKLQKCSPF